jgi:hypothetical protein
MVYVRKVSHNLTVLVTLWKLYYHIVLELLEYPVKLICRNTQNSSTPETLAIFPVS